MSFEIRDGVEYVKLSDIASYSKTRISIDKLNKNNYISVENLLPDKAGKINAISLPKEYNCIYYPVGTVLIGNIRPYLRKIWLSDCEGGTNSDVLPVVVNDKNKMLPEFLYYVLSSEKFFRYDIQNSRGGKMPRGDKTAVMNFSVPVPSLEVQKEIVRVLDMFTECTELLSKELELRKKQYKYYRNKLLTFGDDVDYKTLKEVCEVITKGTTPKLYEKSGISFIKTESFNGRYIDKSKLFFVSPETHNNFLKRSVLKEKDILFSIAGTIGKTAIVTKDVLPANTNQALAIIRLKSEENLKYILYILESKYMQDYMRMCIKGSAQPNLNLTQLSDFKFPYPPIEEQERIVKILDNFDTLCNDLTHGIPAEIALRKKQYEYYRDKLLTFKIKKF
ncbi:MAG: restriction endonuclease subunit S [Ruminococcus sp.]|nr:restriction endonuclease subunit S [Ruminococcus sp.]